MPAIRAEPGDAAGVFVHRRELPAAAARVFAAFADPHRLARWWGPAGFTNEFHAFDFRPGGEWRFTMRGSDGAAYAMHHVFAEIVPPARIAIRHVQPGHDFTLTVTLRERGGRTDLEWHMRFDDPAEAGRVRDFVRPANEQNLDRLAAELDRPRSATPRPAR